MMWILWLDKKLEPITTVKTAWAMNAQEAEMTLMWGMPIQLIDMDDYNEALLFLEWLEKEQIIKNYSYNIHGVNIDSSIKQKLCDILNHNDCHYTCNPIKLNQIKIVKNENDYSVAELR